MPADALAVDRGAAGIAEIRMIFWPGLKTRIFVEAFLLPIVA
jgi:hypothetical protein